MSYPQILGIKMGIKEKMPSYSELATLQTPTGGLVQSKYTASSSGGPTFAGFLYNPDTNNQGHIPVISMFDFWREWIPIAKLSRTAQINGNKSAVMVTPYIFNDDGIVVDAEREWNALPATPDKWIVTVEGALDDDSDFQITATGAPASLDNFGPVLVFSDLTASNEGSNAGRVLIQGHKVDLLYKDAVFLPRRTSLQSRQIWVRSDPVLGDFSQLVIQGEDVLDRGAEKTVRLEAAYVPLLEDLDNNITFGTDANGVPIRWNIAGTERDRGRIFLNLVAFTS